MAAKYPPRVAARTMTLAQIQAEFLPLSKRALQSMLASGRMPAATISIGSKIRLWDRAAFAAWIETQTGATTSPAAK